MTEFEKELETLINRYSIENESNTPDFILAEYLRGCLNVFAKTVAAREKWYGREPNPTSVSIPLPILEVIETEVGDGHQTVSFRARHDGYLPSEGYCSVREDETHCDCWWDGEACCSCGHPPVLDKSE